MRGREGIADVVGEILPCSADSVDASLSSELTVRADLLGDSRHLRREVVERLHHVVDRVLELEDFSLRVDGDGLGKVSGSDGGGAGGRRRGQLAPRVIDKSKVGTHTTAIDRTCVVRLSAIRFTLSVRAFQTPSTLWTTA